MRILVFGDSISLGFNDWKHGGWVQLLNSDLASSKGITVYNCSISGNTTSDVLSRFECEAKARTSEEVVIIFAIGENDGIYENTPGNWWVAPAAFKENLKKLAKLASKFTNKIIFVGLLQVDSRADPIPWDTRLHYKPENIKMYDSITKDFCKENGLLFVDLMSAWLKIDYQKLLADGLHPTTEGHKKIFEQVKEFLVKNKVVT